MASDTNILEKLRHKQAQRRSKALETYGSAARKLAAGDTLTAAEEKGLDSVMAAEGISVEKLEADLTTIREYNTAMETAAELAELKARDAKLASERQAIHQRFVDTRKRYEEIVSALSLKQQALAPRILASERAEATARQLADAHWRVLGLPDPAIRDRTRHLLQTYGVATPETDVEILSFEWLMMNPESAAQQLEQFEFVPAPGQSKAELDRLLEVVREIAQSAVKRPRPLHCYLLREGLANESGPVLEVGFAKKQPLFDTIGYRFHVAPGQTREELDALITEVTKAGLSWKTGKTAQSVIRADGPTAWARNEIHERRRQNYGNHVPEPTIPSEPESTGEVGTVVEPGESQAVTI